MSKFIHLKCYTLLAAEFIQMALERTEGIFPFQLKFHHSNQLFPSKKYVHIDETGELYLDVFDDYDFTINDLIIIMKSLYNMKKIGYRLGVASDKEGKFLVKEERDRILFILSAIIKALTNRKLSKKECKVIGRSLNPFEQVELKQLLVKYSECYDYSEQRDPRIKIKEYVEKIQGC